MELSFGGDINTKNTTHNPTILKVHLRIFQLGLVGLQADYLLPSSKVIKAVLDKLPTEPAVKQITLDFERAVWSALRSVLPEVNLMGCVFHWTQALWRKHFGVRSVSCSKTYLILSVYFYLSLPSSAKANC